MCHAQVLLNHTASVHSISDLEAIIECWVDCQKAALFAAADIRAALDKVRKVNFNPYRHGSIYKLFQKHIDQQKSE